MTRGARAVPGADWKDTELNELQAGQFGSGSSVALHQQLPYFNICNTDSVAHTLTMGCRHGATTTVQIPVAASSFASIPTAPFQVATIDTGGTPADCYWFFSDVQLSGPSLAAGSSGAFSVKGALTVQSGQSASGSLTFIEWGTGPTKLIYGDGGTAVRLEAPGGAFLSYNNNAKTIGINSTGIYSSAGTTWSVFSGINTAGLGVPAEYASSTTTPVTLAATASPGTTITSYAPTANGLFLVVVTITPQTAFSKTGGVTVGYTDITTAGAVLQTQTIASTASAVPQSFTFLCAATTATSITVAGFISTANDAVGSASIFAL